MKQNADNWTF